MHALYSGRRADAIGGRRGIGVGDRSVAPSAAAREGGTMRRSVRWPAATAIALALAWITGLPGRSAAAGALGGAGAITYKVLFNGAEAPEEGRTLVAVEKDLARVQTHPAGASLPTAPKETGYIDFAAKKTYQIADLRDGSRCAVVAEFASLPALEITQDHQTVLGYDCIRAHTVIRSNQIDIWFTRDAGLHGTPSLNLIPPDGLVLRIVRNGNYEILADRIDPPAEEISLPSSWGDLVDLPGYRARVTESYVTTVPVFERERLSFGNEIVNPPEDADSGAFRYAGGTVVVRKVALPDLLVPSTVFAELVQYSNGDAYDRTGSVFILPADGEPSFLEALRKGTGTLPTITGRDGKRYQGIASQGTYLPPIELVRFITPFGIRFYNEQVRVQGLAWEDSVVYKMDVTDIVSRLHGNVHIGAFIGNYDKGGHVVSLRLRYHPEARELSEEPAPRTWIRPLFNTVNVMEMAGQEYARIFAHDSLLVEFDAPAGLKNVVLRYVTTGHGGWEDGDEFTPRVNEIALDGRVVARFTPWRSDCGGFRRLNPASGNFWNGVSSSDLSRSGWCPGQAVSPVVVPLSGLTPGPHTIRVSIPMGAPEGDSFSAWNVSGVLLGEF
jgi:hypothetical protein